MISSRVQIVGPEGSEAKMKAFPDTFPAPWATPKAPKAPKAPKQNESIS